MWYWEAKVGTIPIGAELARVALKTKAEERMVMYHLFKRDQFCIAGVSFHVKARVKRRVLTIGFSASPSSHSTIILSSSTLDTRSEVNSFSFNFSDARVGVSVADPRPAIEGVGVDDIC